MKLQKLVGNKKRKEKENLAKKKKELPPYKTF